jgi:hypothetical protein
MDKSKRAVAERLAEAHFIVDPAIERIFQLLSPPRKEKDPSEPIKLLEVNPHTTSDGIIPVFFGEHPKSGIFYPSIIVEITPEEFDEIERNPSSLPNRWRLGGEIAKPEATVER